MTVALLPFQSITKGFRHLSQVITATVSQTRGIVASLVLEVEQLLGFLQCVALTENGIKSLIPLKYHRVRIRATRSYAFGAFLQHNFNFTFFFHFLFFSPVTPFVLYYIFYFYFEIHYFYLF